MISRIPEIHNSLTLLEHLSIQAQWSLIIRAFNIRELNDAPPKPTTVLNYSKCFRETAVRR
jgi:hypothetical protein